MSIEIPRDFDLLKEEDLRREAEYFVDLSTKLSSNQEPQRKGGYLTVAKSSHRCMSDFRTLAIGDVLNSPKKDKYFRFSLEKAYRTQADAIRECKGIFSDPQILSSWWTRDPAVNRWGGAVLLPYHDEHLIISFSGLLEHVDEAVSLMIGHRGGIAKEEYAKKIIEMSQNPVFPEILEAYLKAA